MIYNIEIYSICISSSIIVNNINSNIVLACAKCACWNCNIEPVICPPHGYQTKKCVDHCCDGETEMTMDCTPGICGGCLVPKWFGDRWSTNKCIPYGFRFQQETSDFDDQIKEEKYSVTLEEQEDNYASLVIESEERAILTLYDKDGNEYEYILTPGAEIVLDAPEFEEYIEFVLYVNDIYYKEGSGYVDVTIRYSYMGQIQQIMNAYCDIDGRIKRQKTPDWEGNSANCQNNYECESNVCSSGECIEIKVLMQEVSAFKRTAVQIVCKFIHPFSVENEDQCVLDLLGVVPEDTPSSSSSSSSGGPGSSSSSSSSGGP